MPPSAIQFCFEFASTYSYPAACRIEDVAGQAGIPLEWRPFLLGPVFRSQGWNDSPFNLFPAKGRYVWRDLERVCAKHGVPFRRPSQFPRNGLLAARIACLAAAEEWCPAFVRAVYHANFADDRDIADPAVVIELLRGASSARRPSSWATRCSGATTASRTLSPGLSPLRRERTGARAGARAPAGGSGAGGRRADAA